MKLSLRSEHALLTLIQLARHNDDENSSLEALAASQQIPAGALAEILSVLCGARYVKQVNGQYRLAKSADKISVAEIIRLFDGALAPWEPVSEMGYDVSPMDQEEKLTGLFTQLQNQVSERLEETTLAELA